MTKILRASSYASLPYRGVLSCGTDSTTKLEAGLPPDSIRHLCSEVRFSKPGSRYRRADLVVNLQPGQAVEIDVAQLSGIVAPVIDLSELPKFGYPVIEVVAIDGYVLNRIQIPRAGGSMVGCTVKARFAGRIADAVWLDLRVTFDPRDLFGRWESTLTCANPNVPSPVFLATASYRLAWSSSGSIVHKAGVRSPILLRAGEQMAQGQKRFSYGAVGWAGSDSGSYLAAAQSGVWAKDLTIRTPLDLPTPKRHTSFNSMAWSNRFFGSTMQILDGYGTDWEIGWLPASGSTGSVEDMGYAKGGDGDEPGALAARYHTAMRWGARPMHWLEPNGELLYRANHPDLILYSGQPYLSGVSSDRLGLSRMPIASDTNGWTGPDPSHSAMNNVFYAAAATDSDAILDLVDHKANYLLFSETLDPAWATSSPGESRALMWSCLAYVNCLRLVKDAGLRERLFAHLLARIERIYLPFYEHQGGVLYRYGADPRSGLSATYTQWMSCWQQAGGAFGLYMIAIMPEIVAANPIFAARLRAVAIQAANLVVDRCITDQTTDAPIVPNPLPSDAEDMPFGYESPPTDTPAPYIVWDTIGLVNGQPNFDASEYVEGHAVHYSGYFREAWVPLGVWVAAKEGHQRAINIYRQMYSGALSNSRSELCWMPELP